MGSKRSFWVRLDPGGGRVSDAFRVKFEAEEEATWREALVEDLKEQLLLQHAELLTSASPTGRLPPTPLLHIVLPPRPGAQEKEKVLAASDALGIIPGGAGEADWHLLVRVIAVKSATAAPRAPPPRTRKGPLTLHEKGVADDSEHPQIRNAVDLSELYPGGVLPDTGPDEFNCKTVLKLLLIFACVIAFMAGAMYFFGNVLPTMLPPVPPQTGPRGVGRHPDVYMPPQYMQEQMKKAQAAKEAAAAATPPSLESVYDESGASAGVGEISGGEATADRTEL